MRRLQAHEGHVSLFRWSQKAEGIILTFVPNLDSAISYGGDEAQLPQNYQRRQCNEFLKLGKSPPVFHSTLSKAQ